ncbi:UDP-N-acetylmuramoyl-tripeptide--D-alanyl-D-alanine ligase [Planctomycetota bacterium]
MKQIPIKTLAEVINAVGYEALDHEEIAGVSIDSRTIGPDECFFCVAGENFDGHDYIDQALAAGAACVVAQRSGTQILEVKDTVKALGLFANYYRKSSNFKVIAITGSVGKTTTRRILSHVLSQHYKVFESPKNFNNHLGLPLTLLGAGSETEIVIAELGASAPGEIAYLTNIAEPDIAVITNVYPAHLQGFGSLEAIVEEKLSIADGLGDDGTLIINGDCELLLEACGKKRKGFVTFGRSECCDICSGNQSNFTIDGVEMTLALPGVGNIDNALAAWLVCKELGIKLADFAAALETLAPITMRAQLMRIGGLTVINDCYNANPASMRNALQILADLSSRSNQRKVFICGDMAELGEHGHKFHEELGTAISELDIQILITVGQLSKTAASAAQEGAKQDLEIKSFPDCVCACNNLEESIKNTDIVLVKGSRAARLELVIERLEELFGGDAKQ